MGETPIAHETMAFAWSFCVLRGGLITFTLVHTALLFPARPVDYPNGGGNPQIRNDV